MNNIFPLDFQSGEQNSSPLFCSQSKTALSPAQLECLALMEKLDNNDTSLGIEATILKKAGMGMMLGVLVCKEGVLRAFSGQYQSKWLVDNWAPPLLDVQKYNDEVAHSDPTIKELTRKIASCSNKEELKQLKTERRRLSTESLKRIYKLYSFYCADRKKRKLNDVYPKKNDKFANQEELLPTGTGDCCAPKLLNLAFSKAWQPLSMAEFFYGDTSKAQGKIHKNFYYPCDEKCSLILPTILGLNILYCDNDIIVVNKPAGLLSIPGRGPEKTDSVCTRLRTLFPNCIAQPSVHRLDMETSGLLVLAFNEEAHRTLSKQFMNHEVYKEYEALLLGNLYENNEKSEANAKQGHIELKFRLDIDNRPHQIYDETNGKLGITDWKLIRIESFPESQKKNHAAVPVSRVRFYPKTGRTHQLRLHSSHKLGLNHPIVGDSLYGGNIPFANRMMLEACVLEFNHPRSGERLKFSIPVEF